MRITNWLATNKSIISLILNHPAGPIPEIIRQFQQMVAFNFLLPSLRFLTPQSACHNHFVYLHGHVQLSHS
jgi:hypothetical protein